MLHKVNVNDGKAVKYGYQWFSEGNTIHDCELMQFTGLFDKNGTEIYEGDILQEIYEDKAEENGFGKSIVEITFKNGAFGWIGDITKKFFSFDSEPIQDTHEVIGNIHEHPELLLK